MAKAEMGITDGKGVFFAFANGLTISIQIGAGNYSQNYNFRGEITRNNPLPSSATAEIAVFLPDQDMAQIQDDIVKGHVPVEKVLRFTEFLRNLPEGLDKAEVELAIGTFDWQEAL